MIGVEVWGIRAEGIGELDEQQLKCDGGKMEQQKNELTTGTNNVDNNNPGCGQEQ